VIDHNNSGGFADRTVLLNQFRDSCLEYVHPFLTCCGANDGPGGKRACSFSMWRAWASTSAGSVSTP
jgi:hypothetical protein